MADYIRDEFINDTGFCVSEEIWNCSQLQANIWVLKNWKSFRHKLFLHLFISSCNVTNVSTLKTIGSKWIRTCLKNKHPWNSYNKIHQKIIVVTAKSHKIACTSFSFNFLCMLLFSFQQLWWGYYLHTMCSVAVDSCNLYIISSKISRHKKVLNHRSNSTHDNSLLF